jgi:hypothetical protein
LTDFLSVTLVRLEGGRSAATQEQDASADAWPLRVAEAEVVVGPYKESKHWSLSFHVEGATPAEGTVPLRRGGPSIEVLVGVFILAATGCGAIVRWAINVF